MEWSETSIKMFVDDVEYYVIALNSSLPFDNDFFLIFNVAMGGSLGGTIDSGFTEDIMEIDYIRVYQ
jgi:beta-glucanase (GH16 family)